MKKSLYLRYSITVGACLGTAPLWAAGLTVGLEVPRLDVAEYHRPYVAVWLEHADNRSATPTTLSVWYDLKMKNAEGTKWLKDMRQWWRRIGRDMAVPIDGVTSATRPAGVHRLSFNERSALGQLPAGTYKLMVEAAREVGGREVLSIPFTWPVTKSETLRTQGHSELGEIVLELKP